MAAFLLAAVLGARVQAGIAPTAQAPRISTAKSSVFLQAVNLLAADLLVAVRLASQLLQGRLDDTGDQAQHKVQSRLLLDVVVSQGAAILQLLAGKDQALLVGGNACGATGGGAAGRRADVLVRGS